MSHGGNLTIRAVNITLSARSGIDIEPNTDADWVVGVAITNVTIHSHLLAITSGGPGHVHNVTISDVFVPYSAVPHINAYPTSANGTRYYWTVQRVVAKPLTENPVVFGACRDMAVLNSTLPGEEGEGGGGRGGWLRCGSLISGSWLPGPSPAAARALVCCNGAGRSEWGGGGAG
jgi:hypothetical protein